MQLKPREKLKQFGPETLTNSELLAIVFNTGSVRESASKMAARAIGDYGSEILTQVKDYEQLMVSVGLTELKSMQLLAVLELGLRLFSKDKNADNPIINSPGRVAAFFEFLKKRDREELRGVYLDSRQQVIAVELISVGSRDAVIMSTNEILRAALRHRARGLILVHNHPSGNPEPSDRDVMATLDCRRAAELIEVALIDHVIVGENYFSFMEGGLFK